MPSAREDNLSTIAMSLVTILNPGDSALIPGNFADAIHGRGPEPAE
jgi:hypothetical protein